jgi:hypothetical protein
MSSLPLFASHRQSFPPSTLPQAAYVYHSSKPFYMDMTCTCSNCESLVQGPAYYYTREPEKYTEIPIWALGIPDLSQR